MGQFAGLFGWIVIWGFCFELMNYIMKFVNKKFITKLPPEKKEFVGIYRTIMKFVIKFHRPVGIITVSAAIVHLALMGMFVGIKLNGIVALALMVCLVFLGIYGAYINKNYKGKWLKAHRFIAFAVILSIGAHLLF